MTNMFVRSLTPHHMFIIIIFSRFICVSVVTRTLQNGVKNGVFLEGPKSGVSKGSKQASCFDGSCHSRCEIEVMFMFSNHTKMWNKKNKTQLQTHKCAGYGPADHKPTHKHHAQIDSRRPHMTLLACSSHQINLYTTK